QAIEGHRKGLYAQRFKVGDAEAADGAIGSERQVRRGLDGPVRRLEPPEPGPGRAASNDRKRCAHRVGLGSDANRDLRAMAGQPRLPWSLAPGRLSRGLALALLLEAAPLHA